MVLKNIFPGCGVWASMMLFFHLMFHKTTVFFLSFKTLFEIISSELAYKKSLQHLVETVIGDMEIKFDIKKGGIECNHLFSNIASVYKVSSE